MQPCRFGAACLTPGCVFNHPEYSTGSKLKWVAPKTATSVKTVASTAVASKASSVTSALPEGDSSVTATEPNIIIAKSSKTTDAETSNGDKIAPPPAANGAQTEVSA